MNAPARIRPVLMDAESFKAWRLRDAVAVPLEIGAPGNLTEALNAACASCGHKDTLFLLSASPVSSTVHTYAIQQGKREYRGPALTRWR